MATGLRGAVCLDSAGELPAQRSLVARLVRTYWRRPDLVMRMTWRTPIAIIVLAACLGGCGGYGMLDPESTAALSGSSGSNAGQSSGSATGASGRRDAATLNALVADAAQAVTA